MVSNVKELPDVSNVKELLVPGICKFALALYAKQSKETTGNIFFSPLSVSSVLSMVLLGAKGQTLEEMKTSLFLSSTDNPKLHQAFGDLIMHLKKCGSALSKCRYLRDPVPCFRLFMANRLFAEKSYHVLEDYQTASGKYYDAELVPVDFIGNAKKTAEEINNWVAECTNQKISDIISHDSIDDTTRLILVNATYFSSLWMDSFLKENTDEADFFVSPQETMKVQMMFRDIQGGHYHYSDNLQCQILKLPYLDDKLSMVILLPDKTSSLDILEGKLSADDIAVIDFTDDFDVNLSLPKFKIEETLELTELLRCMGMESLFSMDQADLSGIDGTQNLYASKVLHKSFVNVNEEGTEAGAGTGAPLIMLCAGSYVDFRADRPFLFFIREEDTKVILFLGRVVKPSTTSESFLEIVN